MPTDQRLLLGALWRLPGNRGGQADRVQADLKARQETLTVAERAYKSREAEQKRRIAEVSEREANIAAKENAAQQATEQAQSLERRMTAAMELT